MYWCIIHQYNSSVRMDVCAYPALAAAYVVKGGNETGE
jgi:hypothetical protein